MLLVGRDFADWKSGTMVRKHYWRTRRRQTKKRPKTPAPKNGWLLAELAKLANLTETTVRYYVAQRLLRPIEVRGTQTRYDRTQLLLLLGFKRLYAEGKSTLEAKKKKLDAMGVVELERWLATGPLPAAAAEALGLQNTVAQAPSSIMSTTEIAEVPSERWQRVTLLPGMELLWREDAKEPVRHAVRRICDEYLLR